MKRSEVIKEILRRFKLDSSSLKQMRPHEYDLIYKSLSEIAPEYIDKSIEEYINKEFSIKK